MKNEIDIQRVLRVFNKMTMLGEKHLGDGIQIDGSYDYHFGLCGMRAQTDFDGYTITLSDAQVSLTVFFHNKYQFDYPTIEALNHFLRRFSDVENYQVQ